MASSAAVGLGLDRLPLSIEAGARLFRCLRLPSATIEAFLTAVRRGSRARAAREALGLDLGQFERLVVHAETLLANPAEPSAGKGSRPGKREERYAAR